MAELERYREKRDFARSPEPAGAAESGASGGRRFVVQKHAARRTHFDLRLEIGGALKSWAVPKGPSADPETKRLAVEVEDHPLDYGDFEGVIPKGEYGAGAVIIWDRGHYQPVGEQGDSDEALERGLKEGKLDFVLFGERMRGRWALVRMKGRDGERNWLLLKKRDVYAEPGEPEGLVERFQDSVVSGRGLDDPAPGDGTPRDRSESARPPLDARPMLAQPSETLPDGEAWCFELKLDGVRAIGWGRPSRGARIYSRRGQRLEAAFPEIAEALELLARRTGAEFVLDGEIVAAAVEGAPRFEDLQHRFNLSEPREIARWARVRPAEMFVFDLLWLGGEDLTERPLSDRKAELRSLLALAGHGLHYVAHDVASGDAMRERARSEGWEGVIAKRLKSRYRPGERTRDWLKVKELARQEFLVCGWTEGGRRGFGALILGYYEERGGGRLLCAGRVGTGFSDSDLREIAQKLEALEQDSSPCAEVPEDLGRARWVRPELVAQVKFQEWTREGRLRQPVLLGLRADVDPLQVVREGSATAAEAHGLPVTLTSELRSLIEALETLEREGEDGELVVLGCRLKVTNLRKVFWPDSGITKGELLRYYVSVAPAILPALQDRPLTLERYPDGITGEMFYQQRAPDPVPEGVRTAAIDVDDERVERLIGGDLYTLLYTAQLAAPSQHVWPSRVGTLEDADYSILDLDPGDGVPFSAVCEAALAVREQLERLGLRAYPKTSGATGIHLVIPLQAGASHETARLLAELVAQLVARSRPELTTVQRSVAKRGERVYLDYLQNRHGLTVASAYSVRPRPGATVSAPLNWSELERDLRPDAFALRSMRERLEAVGDLWVACRSDANDVREVLELL